MADERAVIEINSDVQFVRHNNIIWACNGFDRDHEAGEASRTGYVKFQN